MKTRMLMLISCLCMAAQLCAQDVQTDIKGQISPFQIGVPFTKTINLIFPYAIKSVDKGSSDVLLQKAGNVENVLQLKAGKENFQQTNLTVITGEGSLYSFLLNYTANPNTLNYKIAEMSVPVEQLALLSESNGTEAELKDAAKRIAVKKSIFKKPMDKADDLSLKLKGVYIKDDIFYFQLGLENDGLINFDAGQFRVYIRDAKKLKRTASQELEVVPLFIEGNIQRLESHSDKNIVLAIEKFTIPNKKYMQIELLERNGGRNMKLKITNALLYKAKAL